MKSYIGIVWRKAAFLIERWFNGMNNPGSHLPMFSRNWRKGLNHFLPWFHQQWKNTGKGLTIAIDSFYWYMLSCFILSLCSLNNETWLCSNPGGVCEILQILHDDVIKWRHFPRYWPFVREIHRPPVNFPHNGQLRGALMFSLIYAWTNGWVKSREAGDWRRHRDHYDVTVMDSLKLCILFTRLLWFRYRSILIASAI